MLRFLILPLDEFLFDVEMKHRMVSLSNKTKQ